MGILYVIILLSYEILLNPKRYFLPLLIHFVKQHIAIGAAKLICTYLAARADSVFTKHQHVQPSCILLSFLPLELPFTLISLPTFVTTLFMSTLRSFGTTLFFQDELTGCSGKFQLHHYTQSLASLPNQSLNV